jgi:hypothetical protein
LAPDFRNSLTRSPKSAGIAAPGCAERQAWYTSATPPATTGVERLVPPQVSQATVPSTTAFTGTLPGE